MPRFTTRLIDRTQVADGTLAFAFERPAGFEFTAGQYLTITLPDPLYTDEKGNSRTFSIASPPQDAGRLVIATRMTGSALKRSLAEAPLGTPVSIFGPAGDFTLGPDPTPVVFIAGGIGITPFRSMLLDAAARGLPHRITLIYSNRTPEGAPFHEELARPGQDARGLPLRADDDGGGQVGAALDGRAAVCQCGVPARPRRGHDRADLLSRGAARARRRRHQDRARSGRSIRRTSCPRSFRAMRVARSQRRRSPRPPKRRGRRPASSRWRSTVIWRRAR